MDGTQVWNCIQSNMIGLFFSFKQFPEPVSGHLQNHNLNKFVTMFTGFR